MSIVSLLSRTHMQRALRAVQWLWALPLTLCGLPIWLCMRFFKQKHCVAHIYHAQAAILFVAIGGPAQWLLRRHPFGAMDAMVVGCCVFAQDQDAYDRTLAHEMVHVQQGLRWGPLFPLAYALASAWAHCRGGCAYADNVFERQANGLG
jgi:hypothetical protein